VIPTPTVTIGGLASGLDTKSIVAQLIAIERRPQVRLQQQQRVEEIRVKALRDVDAKLAALATAAAGLRDAATWADVQTVESSDPTRIGVTRTGGAATGGYMVTIGQLARAHQLTQGSALTAAGGADTLSIKVGAGAAVLVAVASGDSLDTIASKINRTSDIPVYATVVDSKLILSSKTTGAANTITVADGDAANGYDLAAALGLAESLSALDASYTLNGGAPLTSSSNTVTNAIAGVTLTLKGTTTSAVTVTVGAPAPDTAAIEKKAGAFVEAYNGAVDFIRGKLTEKKVRTPTTDADLAKGVLTGDAGLSQLLGKLRQAVGDPVSGRPADLQLLSQAGLSTGAATGSATLGKDAVAGRLVLDAARLRDTLTARLADVKALFTATTGSYATEGLAQRIDREVTAWTASDGLLSSRIASGDGMIATLKQRISEIDVRLAQREKTLRAQFTAMETALQAAQSQGDWLAGQLARLSG